MILRNREWDPGLSKVDCIHVPFEWRDTIFRYLQLLTLPVALLGYAKCTKAILMLARRWFYSLGTTRQAMYCTCKVTLMCVRETVVAVEKQWVLNNLSVCICSLRYPACSAHGPYCHLWPAPLYSIFPHYLINNKFFGGEKKVTEHNMCVLMFCTTFVWNISHSKKNCARFYEKCVLISTYITRYSCQILMKLEFSRQIFEKSSNFSCHEKPSNGSRVVSCGQTGQTNGRTDG